ncbi:MAG: NAD(P)/FAD-dependent oxidoreductase [Bacteroidales bacterium]|nr:NAD(P)/FAD-dependent oxidoreductase [Bacteroidales bacterium]
MQKELSLLLTPKESTDIDLIRKKTIGKLRIQESELTHIKILKKSIDARNRSVKMNVYVRAYINEEFKEEDFEPDFKNVENSEPIIIVGSGPAGLFAALRLLELGYKPIVLERGKAVKERKLDIAKINRESIINPNSNYAYGEGGAGTFSDGKLYTRSKKRGNVRTVLDFLIYHGAENNIGVDAHPHIGTNKLPGIIQNIRETIIKHGGEVHFNTHVDEFIIENEEIKGVKSQEKEFKANKVILATGHSARDIYTQLHTQGVELEAKPFAMGVRVEHSQKTIDSIQYHCELRDDYLPAAAYSLVTQVNERGVYSFCMCPGGFIVPAATADNQIVVNGMSPSKRNSKYANSGMVVEIRLEDLQEFEEYGIMAGIKFQEYFENLTFDKGGEGQIAPAQRLIDFVKGRVSSSLPDTSYHPGIISSPMHKWLPKHLRHRLQEGFKAFDKKMHGYLTNDAVIIGAESRTSSPLRIPRDKESLEHIQIKGLYPAGEGAGYAGGIVSAAVDGVRIAEVIGNSNQLKN